MTGFNHRSDCPCGWCVGGWRNHDSRAAPATQRYTFWSGRWSYESFTVPNVRCPYCGEPVFFHHAVNGGRVFFNDLGPPWPKHDCMTASDEQRAWPEPDMSPITSRRPQPAWEAGGWVPIVIDRIQIEDDWFVLKCRRHADNTFLRLLSARQIEGAVRAPALISRMSPNGIATLSFLHPEGTPQQVTVYDYSSHCLSSPSEVEQYLS